MACGTPIIDCGSNLVMNGREFIANLPNGQYVKVVLTGQYMSDMGGRWWECIDTDNKPWWFRAVDLCEVLEVIS